MTTVRIDPDGSLTYVIVLAEGATPGELTATQSYYPRAGLVVGYSNWWPVTVAIDGDVDHVNAAGASVTVA